MLSRLHAIAGQQIESWSMSNPYQSPAASDTYYTADELRLSYGSLWRRLRKFGTITGTIIFVWFAIRKVIGWRFPASYGRHRPDELHFIDPTQVPWEVQNAVQDGVRSVQQAGFELLAITHVPHIGSKWEYGFLFAAADKPMFATIGWYRVRVGQFVKATVGFHCASLLSGNRQLHTTANVEARELSELIPPWIEVDWLPESASIQQVIEHHAATIAIRPDLVSLERGRALELMVATARQTFDYLVRQRLLRPLTTAEVEALKLVHDEPVVIAELAR
jgi:hypothetical protein